MGGGKIIYSLRLLYSPNSTNNIMMVSIDNGHILVQMRIIHRQILKVIKI